VNTFLIQQSFALAPKEAFAFVGVVVSGIVTAGMKFKVPDAGHSWSLTVKSVESVNTADGTKVALLVDDSCIAMGLQPGLGIGCTINLTEAEQ
jgi:hypothetical protein